MLFSILTIFPQLLESPLQEGIIRRAQQRAQIRVELIDIRSFATDKHQMTDDRPFGGGEGMVMKPEPLRDALLHARNTDCRRQRVVLLSPQGSRLQQDSIAALARMDQLILVCGRYEGVDDRFRQGYIDEEISIGDYILSGGELPAMVLVDAITRTLPGVLGCHDSVTNDSFSSGLLKHAQYTRPQRFDDSDVPEVLLSGDHEAISRYRFISSVRNTLSKRPELLAQHHFSTAELKLLAQEGLAEAVLELQNRQTGNSGGGSHA